MAQKYSTDGSLQPPRLHAYNFCDDQSLNLQDSYQNQQSMVQYSSSSLTQNINVNTTFNESYTIVKSLNVLILLESGDQRLCTVQVPGTECTVEWLLEQIGIPYTSNNVYVTEANTEGLDYIIAVGNVPGFNSEILVKFSPNNTVPEQVLPSTEPTPMLKTYNKGISLSHSKEARKLTQEKFAVCTKCGFLSRDFNKCLRCKTQLPEDVKFIVGRSTIVKRRKKENIRIITVADNKVQKSTPGACLRKEKFLCQLEHFPRTNMPYWKCVRLSTDQRVEDQTGVSFTEKMFSEKVLNNQLDSMLKEVKLPCRFQACDFKLLYEDLEEHQYKCVFQTVTCLMLKDDCNWTGPLKDLLSHFEELHSTHIISSEHNIFSFEIDLTKLTNIVKILRNENQAYILKMSKLKDTGSLLHFVRHIATVTEDTEMIIKYNGTNGQHKIKTKCLPFNVTFSISNGTKVRLMTLNEIAEEDGKITVIIKPDQREAKAVNKDLLKYLECPVCQQLMRPPIHQCITGHSFCKICRPKLSDCPTCYQPWGSARNFCLEALTTSINYSCAYSQYGCEATYSGNEIDEHERFCKFRIYPCPISNCEFVGKYLEVKVHFNQTHSDYLIGSTTYDCNFVLNNDSETVQYFFEHSNIYELTFKCSNEIYTWVVRILNSYDINNKFFYIITITDPYSQHRKIIKSNLCLNANARLADYNVISFSYNDLVSYKDSSDDRIFYRFQISDQLPSN